jgi:predicted O-linked N-acetylglucosamine transferase (SPINDLY family)
MNQSDIDDALGQQSLEEQLHQAVIHHQAGNLADAEKLYGSILTKQPGHPDANHNLGVLLIGSGHAAAALPYFQAALQANLREGQFWLSCIDALIQVSQLEAARQMLDLGFQSGLRGPAVDLLRDRLQRPAAASPPIASVVGTTDKFTAEPFVERERSGSKREEDANRRKSKHSKSRQRKGNPDRADALYEAGQTHLAQGSLVEAEGYYRDAIRIRPRFAQALCSLAEALEKQGRLTEAEDRYRQSIEIQPDGVLAHNNLALILKRQGRFLEAEASCRRALELRPDLAVVHNNLSTILNDQGRVTESEASCHRAIELNPDLAEAHNNLAVALNKQGHLKESEASCRRAIELRPELAAVHNNLANVLQRQARPGEAEASCRQAINLQPEFRDAYTNLGIALMDQGRLADAAVSYRRALHIQPELPEAHQDMLFCLSHYGEISPEALFNEHVSFADHFEAPLRQAWTCHQSSREPERRLKVGIVSGDFREHPMVYFIEPVFSRLAADPGLSLHAYVNCLAEDSFTRRLRRHFPHWNQVFGLSDDLFAQKVRADGIDILIDLTGHTAHNRLLAFARKPAPIQCGWIGYLGTSGLKSIDYYLADKYFLPPGDFDRYFTEKIVHLPAVAAFEPSSDAPDVSSLPSLTTGRLTFGSFNRLSKLNPGVIALWSQLLRALPESQMLIGGMPRDGRHQVVGRWFQDEGIALERLQFHPRSGNRDYLALHDQVDFCLDPIPFTGATTTCHALWMGVPTLTLLGHTVAGRLGAALLQHVGLEDFIAHTPEEFVKKGIYWAGNLHSLAQLRAGMRDRFLHSAIGRPDLVAQGLAASFRQMWRSWCASSMGASVSGSVQQ